MECSYHLLSFYFFFIASIFTLQMCIFLQIMTIIGNMCQFYSTEDNSLKKRKKKEDNKTKLLT